MRRSRSARSRNRRSVGLATATGVAVVLISSSPTVDVDHGTPRLGAAPLAAQTLDGAAPDPRHLEQLAARAVARILALQEEAEELASRERSLLVELRELEVRRQLKREELTRLETEIQGAETELGDTTGRITELETAAVEQRPVVESRLVELYKLGQPRYTRLLLGVEDLRSIGRAYRLVSELAELDRRRITEHRETLVALRESQRTLEARHAELTGLLAEARQTRGELDRAVRAQTRLVESIDERRDLTAQLTGELQLANQQLQSSLTAMATGSASAMTAAPLALPLRPFRGDLSPPVPGDVTAPFGRQQHTRFGTTIQRNGIEISADEGTPVIAVHGGQVAYADTFTGFGNLIIIDHGTQSYSLYGYLASLDVERGARVDRDMPLGTVGRAPAGASSLYFELRVDGQPVDPVEWLRD